MLKCFCDCYCFCMHECKLVFHRKKRNVFRLFSFLKFEFIGGVTACLVSRRHKSEASAEEHTAEHQRDKRAEC